MNVGEIHVLVLIVYIIILRGETRGQYRTECDSSVPRNAYQVLIKQVVRARPDLVRVGRGGGGVGLEG